MKILVIGGLGCVGTPLVNELRKRKHNVWVADKPHDHDQNYIRCDISKYRQVEKLFEQDFDYVYSLGAEFGRYNGEDFYETLWESNVIGMKNIIRLQEKKMFKMIFTSSSEVYGDYKGEMSENVLMEYPIRQLNDYAISKWANEQQIMNSCDRHETETVRIRLFNTYGPGEYYSSYRSVICLFVYRALNDLPYTVYLDHHRTSTYIDDTVRTMANIIDNFKSGEVYNISGDEYHDIASLSNMILEELGKDDSKVKYLKIENHNTIDKKGNNEKAKKDLKHVATVNLRGGIIKTIDWQKTEYMIK
jgi:dTDP-glucose 4,6-dehydratase|tara:strand:+ start:44 stop:955 length:912 start_codon:yes stop_codon:yes gene_type:complete